MVDEYITIFHDEPAFVGGLTGRRLKSILRAVILEEVHKSGFEGADADIDQVRFDVARSGKVFELSLSGRVRLLDEDGKEIGTGWGSITGLCSKKVSEIEYWDCTIEEIAVEIEVKRRANL